MGTYDYRNVEKKWQQYWKEQRSFVADKLSDKPKYYVLDMFPYPSGAGLHVGHPLGYIATDIITRYKRAMGFNVMHPMGFDAFGLPAEQYAIKTGIHPAETTAKNITRYNEQLEMLGFHYDPDAVLATSDPDYYKWTQWIFIQLFEHWYDQSQEKARPISELEAIFAEQGNLGVKAATSFKKKFTDADWEGMLASEKADTLMQYRLAYLDYATVNWCAALGTVLANEEVKDGKSERGGYPVERREMKQWMLRITAYADRLLSGLESIDWSESMKSMQTHWIGRSEGASVFFAVKGSEDQLEVFTTRPDTLFGATFMVVAPEHKIVDQVTTSEQRKAVKEYVNWAKNRSEVDRMADTTKTGVWTGGYAINPINGAEIPIWIADYVVISYGTGAIMAVPSGDQRDWDFAKKFDLEIIPITETASVDEGADSSKEAKMINSGFLDGMTGHEAIPAMIAKLEEMGVGDGEVTYRQRDVIWSRQRYWGEPTPIYYDRQGIAHPLSVAELPLTLPEVDQYKPSSDGRPPLSRAKKWAQPEPGKSRDLNTMPGLAGSSWYFMRYVDAHNEEAFADPNRL
ncbi:MAG: class I tRNA ligase family protein, partial [Bacteroidota bacterium]